MNTKILLPIMVSLFIAGSIQASATDGDPKVKTAYAVDTKTSTIIWTGKKVTGEHTGKINLTSGQIERDGKKITGGSFAIDMTSITCTDLTDNEYNQKLVGHLKSDDFFGTVAHPTSQFVITSIQPTGKDAYQVKGNLTIKSITQEISFPATIIEKGNDLLVKAKIIVDRSKYDIRYGSGTFFDNLGDKAIYNDFELNLNLLAKK